MIFFGYLQADVCPRLKDLRGLYFVHAGVMASVNFHAEHIPKVILH